MSREIFGNLFEQEQEPTIVDSNREEFWIERRGGKVFVSLVGANNQGSKNWGKRREGWNDMRWNFTRLDDETAKSPIPFLSGLIERHIESDLFRETGQRANVCRMERSRGVD